MGRSKSTTARSPQRTCIVCRGRGDKAELLRVVYRSGALQADREGRLTGRGGYVHLRPECMSRMYIAARWERALRLEEGTLRPEALHALAEQCRAEKQFGAEETR